MKKVAETDTNGTTPAATIAAPKDERLQALTADEGRAWEEVEDLCHVLMTASHVLDAGDVEPQYVEDANMTIVKAVERIRAVNPVVTP